MERKIQKYKQMGHSDGWIEERIEGTVTRNQFTNALIRALVTKNERIYGHATSEMYKVLWERTTKELRRDLGISKKQNPRDYMGKYALIYIRLTEGVCTKHLKDRQTVRYNEAIAIVKDVAQIYHRQASETSRLLGIDLVTDKPLLETPDQPA